MDTLKQLYVALTHNMQLLFGTLTCLGTLESVPCFACRVCTKSWDDAYCDMLCTLNIPQLSERRELLKMYHLYKIVHGFVDFPNAPLPVSYLA